MVIIRIRDPLFRFSFMGIRVRVKITTRYSENTVFARVPAYYSERKPVKIQLIFVPVASISSRFGKIKSEGTALPACRRR
jgi:hypothetical protein